MTDAEPCFQLPLEEETESSAFPRRYAAVLRHTGLYQPRPPFGTCLAMQPITTASVRLVANNARFGSIEIVLTTWDDLGNYPGFLVATLRGDLPLSPTGGIAINEVGGTASCRIAGTSLTSPARSKLGITVPWVGRTGAGTVCHRGRNVFGERWWGLTQVGFADPAGYRLDAD